MEEGDIKHDSPWYNFPHGKIYQGLLKSNEKRVVHRIIDYGTKVGLTCLKQKEYAIIF